MDSGETSNGLSQRMERAGFKKENAVIQGAMATAMEDLIRNMMNIKLLHLFGSFSDGWGSCMTQIDGRVEAESDIDVTWILDRVPLHISERVNGDCVECESHGFDHILTKYLDGHIIYKNNVTTPNLGLSRSSMLPALDVIVARSCCCYPPIQILEPEYKSHLSQTILNLLKSEIDNPRCHAVAASPPGQEGTCMRVSTTHLERIVMRNLTTIQGQFFVIIKYLVKKVINKRVSGLKTYVAKNLLFYMLDTTPEEEWISTNLVSLVRESLQLLATMIESSAGDDVCMTHFFLRDANVYLRKEHESKEKILVTIQQTLIELPELLVEFERGLDCSGQGNVVHFHCFWLLLFCAELQNSEPQQFSTENYEALNVGHKMLLDDSPSVVSSDLENLIERINGLPDCVKVSRECLKAMLHGRAGRPLSPRELQFDICKGIRTDDSQQIGVTTDDARRQVIQILQETDVFGLDVASDGSIQGSALDHSVSGMASILRRSMAGDSLSAKEIVKSLLDPSQVMHRFYLVMRNRKEQLEEFLAHFSGINGRSSIATSQMD